MLLCKTNCPHIFDLFQFPVRSAHEVVATRTGELIAAPLTTSGATAHWKQYRTFFLLHATSHFFGWVRVVSLMTWTEANRTLVISNRVTALTGTVVSNSMSQNTLAGITCANRHSVSTHGDAKCFDRRSSSKQWFEVWSEVRMPRKGGLL